jgi:hypothetical protein
MQNDSLYLSFLARMFLKEEIVSSNYVNPEKSNPSTNLFVDELVRKFFSKEKELFKLLNTSADELAILHQINELIEFHKSVYFESTDGVLKRILKRLRFNQVFARSTYGKNAIDEDLLNVLFESGDRIVDFFFFGNLDFFVFNNELRKTLDNNYGFSKKETVNFIVILNFFKNYIFYRSLKEKGILKDFIKSLNQAIENEKKIESGVEVYLQNGDFLLKYFDYIDNPTEENKRSYIESLKKLSGLYASNRDFGNYSLMEFLFREEGFKYLKHIFEAIKYFHENDVNKLKEKMKETPYRVSDSVIEEIKAFSDKVAKNPFIIEFDKEIEEKRLPEYQILKSQKEKFNFYITNIFDNSLDDILKKNVSEITPAQESVIDTMLNRYFTGKEIENSEKIKKIYEILLKRVELSLFNKHKEQTPEYFCEYYNIEKDIEKTAIKKVFENKKWFVKNKYDLIKLSNNKQNNSYYTGGEETFVKKSFSLFKELLTEEEQNVFNNISPDAAKFLEQSVAKAVAYVILNEDFKGTFLIRHIYFLRKENFGTDGIIRMFDDLKEKYGSNDNHYEYASLWKKIFNLKIEKGGYKEAFFERFLENYDFKIPDAYFHSANLYKERISENFGVVFGNNTNFEGFRYDNEADRLIVSLFVTYTGIENGYDIDKILSDFKRVAKDSFKDYEKYIKFIYYLNETKTKTYKIKEAETFTKFLDSFEETRKEYATDFNVPAFFRAVTVTLLFDNFMPDRKTKYLSAHLKDIMKEKEREIKNGINTFEKNLNFIKRIYPKYEDSLFFSIIKESCNIAAFNNVFNLKNGKKPVLDKIINLRYKTLAEVKNINHLTFLTDMKINYVYNYGRIDSYDNNESGKRIVSKIQEETLSRLFFSPVPLSYENFWKAGLLQEHKRFFLYNPHAFSVSYVPSDEYLVTLSFFLSSLFKVKAMEVSNKIEKENTKEIKSAFIFEREKMEIPNWRNLLYKKNNKTYILSFSQKNDKLFSEIIDYESNFRILKNQISALFVHLGILEDSFLKNGQAIREFFEPIIQNGGETSFLEASVNLSKINDKTFHKTLAETFKKFLSLSRNTKVDKNDILRAVKNAEKIKTFEGTYIDPESVFTGSLVKLDKYPENKDKIKSTQVANFLINFKDEMELVKKEITRENKGQEKNFLDICK